MQYIKQTFENKFYTYQPGEFLPIWEDGALRNRNEFIVYKIKQLFHK